MSGMQWIVLVYKLPQRIRHGVVLRGTTMVLIGWVDTFHSRCRCSWIGLSHWNYLTRLSFIDWHLQLFLGLDEFRGHTKVQMSFLFNWLGNWHHRCHWLESRQRSARDKRVASLKEWISGAIREEMCIADQCYHAPKRLHRRKREITRINGVGVLQGRGVSS